MSTHITATVRATTIGALMTILGACGQTTPVTDALVTSISAMFDLDLSAAGRRLDRLGVGESSIEDVRRAVGPRPPGDD